MMKCGFTKYYLNIRIESVGSIWIDKLAKLFQLREFYDPGRDQSTYSLLSFSKLVAY